MYKLLVILFIIYDEAFLQKKKVNGQTLTITVKVSIVDVSQGLKYPAKFWIYLMEWFIQCVCKFRKTNISYPLIRTHTCTYQGEKILVFRKLLRTYEMNDSYGLFEECSKTKSPENIRKTSLFNIFRGIEAN